jgi:hypothetical protein
MSRILIVGTRGPVECVVTESTPKFSATEQRAFKAWFVQRYGFPASEAPARLSRTGYAKVRAHYASLISRTTRSDT